MYESQLQLVLLSKFNVKCLQLAPSLAIWVREDIGVITHGPFCPHPDHSLVPRLFYSHTESLGLKSNLSLHNISQDMVLHRE